MTEIHVRPAERADLPRLTEVYNYFVVNTPVTFDVEPYTVERRGAWFEQFALTGRYRLVVAEEYGVVVGYAGTTRFRVKPAYDTTVETTIYCSHETIGKGVGGRLYAALFEAIAAHDVHCIVAGATMPNDASKALHLRCGFREVGVFSSVGFKLEKYWDVAWFQKTLA